MAVDIRQALIGAFDNLVVYGWCQDQSIDQNDRICLHQAVVESTRNGLDGDSDDVTAVCLAITRTINPRYRAAVSHVIEFNDAHGRTLEEVLDLLRATIDRYEDPSCPTPAPSLSLSPNPSGRP